MCSMVFNIDHTHNFPGIIVVAQIWEYISEAPLPSPLRLGRSFLSWEGFSHLPSSARVEFHVRTVFILTAINNTHNTYLVSHEYNTLKGTGQQTVSVHVRIILSVLEFSSCPLSVLDMPTALCWNLRWRERWRVFAKNPLPRPLKALRAWCSVSLVGENPTCSVPAL